MKNLIYLITAGAILFASCQKTVDYDKLSSDFIVSTSFDKAASFAGYKTYYVSDTVINLGGTGADTILLGPTAQALVSVIKTNMNNRGYNLVGIHAKPDLGVRIGVVEVENIDVYPGWYDGYPGWFPYYWGGYYPYYYPWTTVYTYSTGSVVVDTYDLKNAKTNGQYKAIWSSTSFGALGTDATANVNRGVNAINQAFIQSPYYRAN